MKKFLPLIAVVLSFNCFSSDVEQESAVNFLEATFDEFDYVKPERFGNASGKLIASDLALSRADLTVNIRNKNKVFDAGITLNKESIAFNTDVMSFDFKLRKNSDFHSVDLLKFKDINTTIYPLNFQASGMGLKVKYPDMGVALNNFFIYCSKNDPEFDMATARGIEVGCLHEFSLSAKDTKKLANFRFDLFFEDGNIFTLDTDLKNFDLAESNKITAIAKDFRIDYTDFVVKTSDLYGSCDKDPSLDTLDHAKILKDCENTINLRTDRVIISDTKANTRFLLKPDFLKISNQRIEMDNQAMQFVDSKGAVTMYGFNLACDKSDEATAYDLHSLIGECLKSGDLDIRNTVTKETRSLLYRYNKVLEGQYDPLKDFNENDSEVKDLNIQIRDNKLQLKMKQIAKIPLFGQVGRIKILIDGETTHLPEEGKIIFKIVDVDLKFEKTNVEWLFRDAVKYVSEKMAEIIVNNVVSFDGDRTFTITL